jgi:hypothetical protein
VPEFDDLFVRRSAPEILLENCIVGQFFHLLELVPGAS